MPNFDDSGIHHHTAGGGPRERSVSSPVAGFSFGDSYEDRSESVSDERIAKLIQKRYDHCERLEKPFDRDKACFAKRLGANIDRVERVCECLACGTTERTDMRWLDWLAGRRTDSATRRETIVGGILGALVTFAIIAFSCPAACSSTSLGPRSGSDDLPAPQRFSSALPRPKGLRERQTLHRRRAGYLVPAKGAHESARPKNAVTTAQV